jgi:VanZ family protein
MRIARYWWPPLVWAVVILIGTSIPNPQSPPTFDSADKLVHFVLYGVLGLLLARAAATGGDLSGSMIMRLVALCAIGAALDEWHQRWIPGRSAELGDWVADSTGAGALILGSAALARFRHANRSS